MSEQTLKNEFLTLVVKSKGAELQSIKSKDGVEYLWQGDKEFWGRRAPILFPIVGRLKNESYNYEGKNYQLSGHGFARDKEFKLEHKLFDSLKNQLEYELKYDDETLAVYPFKFSLKIIYRLVDNQIEVKYIVKNLDDKPMFFGIGAHPAFNIPVVQGNFEDYMVTILPEEKRARIPLDVKEGTLHLDQEFTSDQSEYPLTRELFSKDALIFRTPDPTDVIISNRFDERRVKVSYQGMPYLGIWSPYPKEAPFVCLEPWCGLADDDQTDGDIMNKYAVNELLADQKFECKYTIEID
ncbi:aldose 1-epimerase family protein [Streptococcaceae bacterium ESL0687]|nr:aldose 1-epimerase family protein [Streptococcaceae bacterium ESL0687]